MKCRGEKNQDWLCFLDFLALYTMAIFKKLHQNKIFPLNCNRKTSIVGQTFFYNFLLHSLESWYRTTLLIFIKLSTKEIELGKETPLRGEEKV